MGLLQQSKKTRKEVQGLRADAARRATEDAVRARAAREAELFQALPPEGKAEFRAAKAAYEEQSKDWSGWKRGCGGKEVRRVEAAFAEAKTAVFRKYDLIP